MIAHVVFFRPRSDFAQPARTELAAALEAALRGIPSIRRARVGSRVVHGRPYEMLMQTDYSYAAILEFDDLAGLKAYLEHPAHQPLASHLFETFEDVLIYDFEVQDGAGGLGCVL